MVLDTSLLNTQHYKVRIKGKVKQSREGVAPFPTPWCSSYRKGSLRVANFLAMYIVDNINTQLMDKLQLNKWKNTKAVTNWFTANTNKNNAVFIQFDITLFYPSIIGLTLDRSQELAA